MNKTVIHVIIVCNFFFFDWNNNTCYYFSFVLVNQYIYVILDRLTEIKAYNLHASFA